MVICHPIHNSIQAWFTWRYSGL